jgi:hypothetical protein
MGFNAVYVDYSDADFASGICFIPFNFYWKKVNIFELFIPKNLF